MIYCYIAGTIANAGLIKVIYHFHHKKITQILSIPFCLNGSSKCTNYVNVHKLYAVECINTVWSIPRLFISFSNFLNC